MFFEEKITLIKGEDKVLEIGPGGSPYFRSDVFLEKNFNEEEMKRQRGNTKALQTDKKVVYYKGGVFPFNDKEFDYIVCSHVVEHVPADELPFFLKEIQRVGKKGYIEFPTLYYDYMYNIEEHLNLMNLDDNNCILFMRKEQTMLNEFFLIQKFFFSTLENSYVDLVNDLKEYFFKGFEWEGHIDLKEVTSLNDLVVDPKVKKRKKNDSSKCIKYLCKPLTEFVKIIKSIIKT